MKLNNAIAAILCGGKSRRMGFDKALIRHREHSLLAHNAVRLAELFDEVVLVSNEREKLRDIPELSDFPVLIDRLPGYGPLGGIYTVLSTSPTPLVFVMACDMPNVSVPLIRRMYEQAAGHQVVLCRQEERLEPLFSFYHKSCLPVFEEQLESGQLQIRASFPRLSVKALTLTAEEGEDVFLNLNTPQELARWKTEPPNWTRTEKED